MLRCPGQDLRFWKPDDIFEVKCPNCSKTIEFFKDKPKLKCRKCGQMVLNPKIDLGCAEWCRYAKQCIGISKARDSDISPGRPVNKKKKASGRRGKNKDN